MFENPQEREEKFKKIMEKEEMAELTKSLIYIAQIRYPNPEHPTIIGKFKTKEERDKWYKEQGSAWEDAAQKSIEFTESPEE